MAHDKFRDFGENPLPQVDLSKVKSDALSRAVDDLDSVTTDEELERDIFFR